MTSRKIEFAEGSDVTHCALGAIQLVTNTWGEVDCVHDLLRTYISKLGYRAVPDWNDAPDRTQDDVREMFLSVAKDLRNGE